tara:strand:- start:523 stop:1062 length:540 start_codon:yes stop_codon:yes gene_type:complete
MSAAVSEQQTDIIELAEWEADLCKWLSQGRFDRARERNADRREMGKNPDKYNPDRIGLYAELAFAKKTDVYPSQVLSPKIYTKISGQDMGDQVYQGLNFDVKATVHEKGRLWIDQINKNIDYYVFMVVSEDNPVRCRLAGVIEASVLHAKDKSHPPQFKFPCIVAEQSELTPWEEFRHG